jgi:hypothetical protein
VDEVLPADGADFALREEAGHGQGDFEERGGTFTVRCPWRSFSQEPNLEFDLEAQCVDSACTWAPRRPSSRRR